MRESRRFLVNLMSAGSGELCTLFASKATDKFRGVAWRPFVGGLPHLHEDSIA